MLIGARDAGRGERAARQLREDGIDARHVLLDVTEPDSVKQAAAWIDHEFGRLDVLVNNAGIVGPAGWRPPSETSAEAMRDTYDTNVFGVVEVTNAMLPLLLRSPAGRLVNLSSPLGSLHLLTDPGSYLADSPSALLLAYNSSKSALNAVTAIYAAALRDTSIKVNAVNPGYCATDLNDHRGTLPAAVGAHVPVQAATLPDDGPTGTFFGADGPIPW